MSKDVILQDPFVQSIWNELQMLKAKVVQTEDSNGGQRTILEGLEKNSLTEVAVEERLAKKVW